MRIVCLLLLASWLLDGQLVKSLDLTPGVRLSSSSGSALEFVRQSFPMGVPYSRARQVASLPGSSAQLVALLADEAESKFWTNVVLTLGIGGDPSVAPVLRRFLAGSAANSPESLHAYEARSSVPLALGCMIYAFDHPIVQFDRSLLNAERQKTLDFLGQGLRPSFWSENALWTSPNHPDRTRRNLHLVMLTAQGLGLSGNVQAYKYLRQAATHLTVLSSAKTNNFGLYDAKDVSQLSRPEIFEVLDAIEDSIKVNSFVGKNSLVAYYKDGRRH